MTKITTARDLLPVGEMEQLPSVLPVLPIRNAVLFPFVSMPLVVGRERSIQALEVSEASGGLILVVAQRVMTPGNPDPEDLYRTGTLCKIESVSEADPESRQVVVTGVSRFHVSDYRLDEDAGFISARGETVADVEGNDPIRSEALFHNLKALSHEILELLPGATDPLVRLIDRVEDPGYLTHVCAAYLSMSLSEKQELLEAVKVEDRMERLLQYMKKEREVLSLQQEIRDKMAERLNKAQREALLREQLRTIRLELGDEAEDEISDNLEAKVNEAGLSEEADRQAREELKRLRGLPPNSAEYHVIRTYLEWLAVLPWKKRSEAPIDLERAHAMLEEDHYGLQDVKKRILQFLAVARLKNDLHGPILCLVGPPGVGKTSLGHSVARVLGREFVRTSLGGVRDEAEIRGHRRTYVGALPGRIIQSMKRAGTKNPVMLLDEIDKLYSDFHGDPSAAMLEVLDPEQNRSFTDHYLDVPFDLSDVFFICTANVVDTISPALRDRMEVIEVNGYTSQEKLMIARKYLIARQLRENGLKPEWVSLPDDMLDRIITHHTREAGVRELQRKIAALFRSVAERIVRGGTPPVEIGAEYLDRELGAERFYPEFAERSMKAGVALGLSWTPHGGDLLYVEATSMPAGKGRLVLTGQLGSVMRESAQIALSLVRSAGPELFATEFDFRRRDIHIHVPAGGIPKDGPSAGVTVLTALASLLLGKPVRPGLAMTGEVTLRGAVLPVGGIREKVLAAHRAGTRQVLLPRRNLQDLREIPEEVRNELQVLPVETVDEVLTHALGVLSGAPVRKVA